MRVVFGWSNALYRPARKRQRLVSFLEFHACDVVNLWYIEQGFRLDSPYTERIHILFFFCLYLLKKNSPLKHTPVWNQKTSFFIIVTVRYLFIPQHEKKREEKFTKDDLPIINKTSIVKRGSNVANRKRKKEDEKEKTDRRIDK